LAAAAAARAASAIATIISIITPLIIMWFNIIRWAITHGVGL